MVQGTCEKGGMTVMIFTQVYTTAAFAEKLRYMLLATNLFRNKTAVLAVMWGNAGYQHSIHTHRHVHTWPSGLQKATQDTAYLRKSGRSTAPVGEGECPALTG
eukprot:scpid37865/ scgid22190/ 